ncbi:hypothetical protein evm_006987 [Chilo suppressalis]|nr:hypothetical protein evm_006987 [Chilo suppressalis]
MGDQKHLSRVPPCFGRHLKPLVPAASEFVSSRQSALGPRDGDKEVSLQSCGQLVEALMIVWLDDLSAWLRSQVFVVFERMSEGGDVMPGNAAPEPDLEKTCAAIMDNMPTGHVVRHNGRRRIFIQVRGSGVEQCTGMTSLRLPVMWDRLRSKYYEHLPSAEHALKIVQPYDHATLPLVLENQVK